MVRMKGPLNSEAASGWLGKLLYHRTGVVRNPYPTGILGHININYSIPAFALNPYARFIAQYYSVKGWIYTMRRTWHGMQPTAIRAFIPPDPQKPIQVGIRSNFKDAVSIWQAMNQATKNVYNNWTIPKQASGYNRFISWYLRTTPNMPIYWGTLQRSVSDSRSIENKMVDQDTPTIRYPFNFRQYQLFNMVVHKGPGFPENPVQGQLFYRSDESKLYKFDDPAWAEVGAGVGAGHTIQDEMSSLPARTFLNFYGLGVQGGDDPGNNRTNIYIPKFAYVDTRIATVIVALDGSGDYVSIQAGIDALPAGGGLVFIKNGEYPLTAKILITKSNVTIEGQSDATILKLNNGINVNVIELGNGATPYTNIHIKNLKIDGNGANQASGKGVYITTGVTYSSVTGCHIFATKNQGIYINSAASYNDILKNNFDLTLGEGLYINVAQNILVQANKFNKIGTNYINNIQLRNARKIRIIGNNFFDDRGLTSGVGINLEGIGFVGTEEPEDITILGNSFDGVKTSVQYNTIVAVGVRVIFQSNNVKNTYSHGVHQLPDKSVILGNIINSSGESGIYLASSFVACLGNQINNSVKYAIHVVGVNDNLIKDNIIDTCGWDAIYLYNSSRNEVTGNRIQQSGNAFHNLFSGIFVRGENFAVAKENNIYDNIIQLPSSGNRKAYSIREYGAYCDYNLIRGNRAKNAIRQEIQVIGANTEAFDNQLIGI